MFKRWLISFIFLLSAAPLTAQTGFSIRERLADDLQGRFSILVAALDATGLTENLNSMTASTLLAPTDAAFVTLADFLGVSTDDLLADTDRLRRILLYHIVPGKVFFRQWMRGEPYTTALNGAAVRGTLVNGFLNIEGAQVSDVDNVTTNGVIQVLDRVLIAPGVFAPAHIRFAHFSPDAPALDIAIDGVVSGLQGLAFPAITEWLELPAAIHSIAFVPSGAALDDAVIIPSDFTLRPESWITLAAVGSLDGGTLFPVLIREDSTPISDGDARITVLAAVEGAPPLDFRMNGGTFVARLGFPFSLGDNDGYYSFDRRAGESDIEVKNYGNSTPFSIQQPDTPIVAGKHYLFAVIGTVERPTLVVAIDQR
jgi:uncharacterized surface protein with fasciclin (FAS1) repeats